MKISNSPIIHPVLFSIFFILFLYSYNGPLNKKVSSYDISSFMSILEKNSFEFDWLEINSKFKNEFYYNGGLVDVNISIERVMEFLNENKMELEKLAMEHNKIIKNHRVE